MMGSIFGKVAGFGRKALSNVPGILSGVRDKVASSTVGEKLGGVFKNAGEKAAQGARNQVSNVGHRLREAAGKAAGKVAVGGTVLTAANVVAADGNNVFEKVGNGVSNTIDQVVNVTKAGGTVINTAASGVNSVATMVNDVASEGPEGFFDKVSSTVSGFVSNISNMIPENMRGLIAPALLGVGALTFSGSGIMGTVGKVALGGAALALVTGNAGGLGDAAKSLIPTQGGWDRNPEVAAALQSELSGGMSSEESLASDLASRNTSPDTEIEANLGSQELSMA